MKVLSLTFGCLFVFIVGFLKLTEAEAVCPYNVTVAGAYLSGGNTYVCPGQVLTVIAGGSSCTFDFSVGEGLSTYTVLSVLSSNRAQIQISSSPSPTFTIAAEGVCTGGAANACKTVYVLPSAVPSIAGTPCLDARAATSTTYTVSIPNGATQLEWSINDGSGWTIVGGSGAGTAANPSILLTTSTTVTVNFNGLTNYVGTIRVRGVRSCGTSSVYSGTYTSFTTRRWFVLPDVEPITSNVNRNFVINPTNIVDPVVVSPGCSHNSSKPANSSLFTWNMPDCWSNVDGIACSTPDNQGGYNQIRKFVGGPGTLSVQIRPFTLDGVNTVCPAGLTLSYTVSTSVPSICRLGQNESLEIEKNQVLIKNLSVGSSVEVLDDDPRNIYEASFYSPDGRLIAKSQLSKGEYNFTFPTYVILILTRNGRPYSRNLVH